MSDPSRMEGLNFELLYHETLRLVVSPIIRCCMRMSRWRRP